MADIDQIIAGGQGSSSRADFSGLADIPDAYWKGKTQAYTQQGRDLFKAGVPTIQNPDGTTSVDWSQVSKALLGHGDVPTAVSTETTGIARDQLRLGAQALQQQQGYETGRPQQPLLPPSVNSQAPVTTPPPLNRGDVQPQPQPQFQPQPQVQPRAGASQGGSTVMQIVAASGIPNTDLANASASVARQLGVAPGDQIDINDPQVRNVLVPALQQLKRMGLGNVIPNGQPAPPPQPLMQGAGGVVPANAAPGMQVAGPGGGIVQPDAQGVYPRNSMITAGGPPPPVMAQGPGSSAPIQPTPVPTQAITGQPAPVTAPVTGTTAPAVPSRVDQGIALYAGQMANPGLPQSVRDAAKARLEFLQKSAELTPEQKNYIQAKLQGFTGTMQELAAQTEADKTYAAKSVESNVKKYDTIQEIGTRARVDLPQLQLAKTLMADPNYMSGVGEPYNLIYKRLLAQFGGDPDAAVPQEAFRKIISANILDQIKGLAGTGPVRVAEMNIIKDASASQNNSPQANRLLVEIQSRLQQRAATISDMAQNYKNGRLDSGFDRVVANYDRANPLISDNEIPDFRKIIGTPKTAQTAPPAVSTNPYEAEMRKRGKL